jgi:CelD/BcsL family acetyltransferase involved in cellulose biosynthesis
MNALCTPGGLAVKHYRSFADPDLTAERWEAAAARGATRTVFQSFAWHSCWWAIFGRGELVIATLEDERRIHAIAPLFIDGGMAFLVGSGGSDYLNLIGDPGDAEILAVLLNSVVQHRPDLLGIRFYLVPDASQTGAALRRAAARLDWHCHEEESLVAPALDFITPATAQAAANKTSLVRHERRLQRDGALVVTHHTRAEAILPRLNAFFAQHEERWAGTPFPSLFREADHRAFYRRLVEAADETGWLRFTTVEWNGEAIAYHFGFCDRGRYLWYKPSFAIRHARYSPGEVLLRHLILAAADEGARCFDFGIGDEPFKSRFANRTETVRTWGVYPRKGSR